MRRVVKVGGSLLGRGDLRQSLPRWISSQADSDASETLVIVGGGELIDAIRRWDAVHPGDATETHWLCIDLLDTTSGLLAGWFDWPLLSDRDELQLAIERGFPGGKPIVVAVRAFHQRGLATLDPFGVPLDWRTTSDSLAALLAIQAAADELVLLKSCAIDPQANLDQLAGAGVVDEALPMLAPRLPAVRVEQLA
jgi:aspartokinase-like uncharacterized kinase